jgi:hypothetical protein
MERIVVQPLSVPSPGGNMNGYPIFMVLLAGYITFLIATGYYFNKRQLSLR